MENSKPLATESFSYSWLVDRKQQHSLDVLTDLVKSHEKDQNFNFDVSLTSSFHAALVHADEIFADGHLMPIYALKPTPDSVPPLPFSLYAAGNSSNKSKKQCLVGRWRRSSKRILHKCFALMRPLYKSVGCLRKSSRVDDLERKVCEVRSWSNSLQASPRPRSAADRSDSKINSRAAVLKKVRSLGASPQSSPRLTPSRSSSTWCGDESSIHEAILYCKKSIGGSSCPAGS